MRDESPYTISVKNLSKKFKTTKALSDINFSVKKGELFGVLGPDGAGKTTLCRILAGIMTPTSGNVTINGLDIVKDSEKIKTFTGYMPRDYGLYGDLSVEENITFYADIFRVSQQERKDKMDSILEITGMSQFKKRVSGFLSGGMKQKLQLACALIHTPEFLILDEPTYGVDPVSRREFWKMLLTLLQDGLTIVVSTSYMDEAERCNRIALLHSGSVLKLDRPEKIIESLPGKMIELSCKGSLTAAEKLEQIKDIRKVTLYGETLHVLMNPGADESIIAKILGQENITHMAGISPSLEDSFIFLVEAKNEQ